MARTKQVTKGISLAEVSRSARKAEKRAAKAARKLAKADKKSKRRWHPGTVAKREIRRYGPGGPDADKLLIPRAPLERLIREIASEQSMHNEAMRFAPKAIDEIHGTLEEYVAKMFVSTNEACKHRGRQTIHVKDWRRACRIAATHPDNTGGGHGDGDIALFAKAALSYRRAQKKAKKAAAAAAATADAAAQPADAEMDGVTLAPGVVYE